MPFGSSIPLAETPWLSLAATPFVIAVILGLIFLRRVTRARHFRIRDQRASLIRQDWERIVSREIPTSEWYRHRVDREIVESAALDRMEVATPEEAARLVELFQTSGLLDRYKHAARHGRGWQRHDALLALGRIGAVEAVPVLVETLERSSGRNRLAAMRALGRIGTIAAGVAIIRNLQDPAVYPVFVLESALACCFRNAAGKLLALTLDAADAIRPLLARVLADVAVPGMPAELLALASDPLAEVRASSARILAVVRPPGVTDLLTRLATDPEWFVRIRTMVALKELADPFTIPVLIRSLCDRNRLVRLRAATALAAMEGREQYILPLAMRTNDRYALQALISELERSGKISHMVDALALDSEPAVEAALLAAIDAGAARFLLNLAVFHPNALVQRRLLALFARSNNPALLECLEQTSAAGALVEQRARTEESGDPAIRARSGALSRSQLKALIAEFQGGAPGLPRPAIIQ